MKNEPIVVELYEDDIESDLTVSFNDVLSGEILLEQFTDIITIPYDKIDEVCELLKDLKSLYRFNKANGRVGDYDW